MATGEGSPPGKTVPHPDDSGLWASGQSYTFDSASSSFDFSSVAVSSSSSKGYSATYVCGSCGLSPCSCQASSMWSSVTIGPTGVAEVGVGELAKVVEGLVVCIVCGAEDCIVLCEVCIEAVKLARNRWLDEFRREIESLHSK